MDIINEMNKTAKKGIIPAMIFNQVFFETIIDVSGRTIGKSRQRSDNYERVLRSLYDKLKDNEDSLVISAHLLINLVYNQSDNKLLNDMANMLKSQQRPSSNMEVI